MKIYVAFDSGHKERAKLTDNYSQLKELLEANDIICHDFLESSITQDSLQGYDILVFACPDFAKISRNEILEIENWVKQDGGGLLLLSHAGGDKGRSSNLSELSEIFGIMFENDQVLDTQNNFGLENLPIISNFTPPHPITTGIEKMCYRAGCSVSVIGSAIPIAISNESSDPFSSPLICVSEPENGRICCNGSYEMFRDKIGGGLLYETHTDLVLNIFRWLVSEYRLDLKSTETYTPPEPQASLDISEMDLERSLTGRKIGGSISPNLKVDIRISNKSDLINLLQTYLDHIKTMEETLENLIKAISISEDQVINVKEKSPEQNKQTVKEPLFTEEDFESLKDEEQKITTGKNKEKATEEEIEEEESENEQIEEEQIEELEEITEEFEEDIEEEIINVGERREELREEVGSLEKKLKSLLNLMDFIEKNYISGKMDENDYNKQKEKLHTEIKKIRKRIGKISSVLEK